MNNDKDDLVFPDLMFTELSSSPTTIDTITLSDMTHTTLSVADITISGSTIHPYISTTSGSNGFWSPNVQPLSVNQSGAIELRGENADIKINGVSLTETLQVIQDRLNILKPNKELENEWNQLRELGERYRELEKQFAEKQKMWDTLKSMPPPEID